jgi:fibronectin type 3 domain-containing protein
VREADAQKVREFEDRVQTETLKSFKDCPDEVKQIYVIKSLNNSVEVSWDAPDDNNFKIVSYNVYLSDKIIHNVGSEYLKLVQDDPNSSNHNFKQVDTINEK